MNCLTVMSKIIFGLLGSLFLASGVIFLILACLIIWGYINDIGKVDIIVPTNNIIIASVILIAIGFIFLLAGVSSFFNACFSVMAVGGPFSRCCHCYSCL